MCERARYEYAILFASASRGKEREYSNVDLAVKFSAPGDPVELASDLAVELEERPGKRVDVVPVELADSILKFEIFWRGSWWRLGRWCPCGTCWFTTMCILIQFVFTKR